MPKLLKTLIISAFFFLCFPAYAAPMPQIPNPFDSPKLQISLSTLGAFSAVQDCKDDDSKKCVYWIGEYIAAIFKYAIGAVGILAAVVLMVGGIIWLTSGGNQTRVGEAKSWIGASLTGLIIALSSYLILYQINPELIKINPIKVAIPEKIGPVITTTSTGAFADKPSAELSTFIACIQRVPNLRINSITDTNIAKGSCNPADPNEQFNSPTNCQHTQYSCHYGGKSDNCVKNGSYAIDVDNNVDGKTVALYAASCGGALGTYDSTARCILNENGTHHHVSIGPYYSCACDTGISSCASQK
jgi:hypothetical protein